MYLANLLLTAMGIFTLCLVSVCETHPISVWAAQCQATLPQHRFWTWERTSF